MFLTNCCSLTKRSFKGFLLFPGPSGSPRCTPTVPPSKFTKDPAKFKCSKVPPHFQRMKFNSQFTKVLPDSKCFRFFKSPLNYDFELSIKFIAFNFLLYFGL